MAAARVLIVNADDLGLSEAVNTGIAAAHERGIVTSASLMVRQGAAPAEGRLSGLGERAAPIPRSRSASTSTSASGTT